MTFTSDDLERISLLARERGWRILGLLSGTTSQFALIERAGTHTTRFATVEWTGEAFVGGHYDMTRNRAFNDLVHRAKGA